MGPPSRARPAPPGAPPRPALPLAGLAVGIWALLPPYTGPELNTAARVEVADHVVPGVVVLAVSAAALLLTRRPPPRAPFLLVAGLVVVLAGIWMTSTHLPLVRQATQDQAPVGAVVYHTVPGLAVLAVGMAWAWRHRGEAS